MTYKTKAYEQADSHACSSIQVMTTNGNKIICADMARAKELCKQYDMGDVIVASKIRVNSTSR